MQSVKFYRGDQSTVTFILSLLLRLRTLILHTGCKVGFCRVYHRFWGEIRPPPVKINWIHRSDQLSYPVWYVADEIVVLLIRSETSPLIYFKRLVCRTPCIVSMSKWDFSTWGKRKAQHNRSHVRGVIELRPEARRCLASTAFFRQLFSFTVQRWCIKHYRRSVSRGSASAVAHLIEKLSSHRPRFSTACVFPFPAAVTMKNIRGKWIGLRPAPYCRPRFSRHAPSGILVSPTESTVSRRPSLFHLGPGFFHLRIACCKSHLF